MPRNTVAVQDSGPPDPSRIRFFMHDSDGKPSSFLRLPDVAEKDYWLWANTAVYRNGFVLALCIRITGATSQYEALSFRPVDAWLARIQITPGDPPEWPVRYEPLPWSLPKSTLSAASFVQEPWLFLLGMIWSPADMLNSPYSILARVAVSSLGSKVSDWEVQFLSAGAGGAGWTTSRENLQPVYRPGSAETTLFYDAPRRRFLATTVRPDKPELYLLTSPALEGPWSEPIHVFTCTEGIPRERYLFYCLRMHPHLSSHPDELVVSYIVNGRSVSDVLDRTDNYFPHFLRIDLRNIP